jgi:hypothetical protein
VDAGLIVLTGVRSEDAIRPEDFRLAQNYPNPFNPTTTVSYFLPVGGTVFLKVFSLDGREVAALVNENQSVGEHRIQFNAAALASGVYICRLQMGGFVQARKLLLLK